MDVRTILDKIISDAETGERAPGHALRWPRLHPYLPDRHAPTRLAAGSRVLCGYALRGLRRAVIAVFTEDAKKPPTKAEKPSTGEKDTSKKRKKAEKKAPPATATPKADWLERAAIGLFGSLVGGIVLVTALATVGPRLHPYVPVITGTGVLGLLVAAWIAAPEPAAKKAQSAAEEAPEEDPAGDPLGTPEGRRLAFLLWLEKTTRGGSGIHLDQMHHQLTQQEATKRLARHHLRPLLDHYRIPVERTLRVGTVAGRSGVKREAVLAALRDAETPPPLAMESGIGSRMESGADLAFSVELSNAPRPVESGS